VELRFLSQMKRSRALQAVAATFGVVFLGAIGSGLWELLLSPIFDWIGSALLNAMSWVFASFADFMYRQVSRDPSENFARLPYIALVTTILFLPWALSLLLLRVISRTRKALESAEEEAELNPTKLNELDQTKRLVLRFMLPVAALTSLMYASVFYQDLHAWRAAIFVERSIAILAPEIDASSRLRLQADFRSIETADDFYRLEDTLRQLAAEKNVKLPAFTSIR